MTYRGLVKHGVIVLDPPVVLPEGSRVEVSTVPAEASAGGQAPPSLAERYAQIVGIVDGLPPDLAAEHDHYLHGTPRREGG